MKKFLNIMYWIFVSILGLGGLFFLALTYIPSEYVAPFLAQLHISYEWCIGLTTTSFATVCIFVVTRITNGAIIRNLSAKAQSAYAVVGDNTRRMDTVVELFTQLIKTQNDIGKRMAQLESNQQAVLELEKQTAQDRLANAFMTADNKAELNKALEVVTQCEQRTTALKALETVFERIVEREVEPVPTETPKSTVNGMV